MTDNEIIKALECCTSKGGCIECPLYIPEQTGSCVKSVFVNALDLIKHQQVEIERLQTEKDALIKTYAECQVDNLKAFVEMLKEKAYVPKPYGATKVVDVYDIDNLVQEFMEATK